MMYRKTIIGTILALYSTLLCAQSHGGGVYVEGGGKCVGNLIYDNESREGFGVAGEGGAAVINSTILLNKKIKEDTTRIEPGYIYCDNGDIVDTATYQRDNRRDAIGVVFWVNSDSDIDYPQGAVIGFTEEKYQWGGYNALLLCKERFQDKNIPWEGIYFLKDTGCYVNNQRMEDKYQGVAPYPANHTFEAGHWCWEYRSANQSEDAKPRWCMPTYLYLRQIFSSISLIERTMAFLKRRDSAGSYQYISGKSENDAWYMTSDDRLEGKDECMSINMLCGFGGMRGGLPGTDKEKLNWTRPMFKYGKGRWGKKGEGR